MGTQGTTGSQGPQGEPGPPGPAGSDATINGVAAGGSLAGTYPNPTIAPAAIGTNEMANVPIVGVSPGVDQPIPNNTMTVVSFGTEAYDPAGMHAAARPARLVAPVAGIYMVSATIQWASNGAGTYRYASLRKNGAPTVLSLSSVAPVQGNLTAQTVSAQLSLAQDDYVEVYVAQDSGAALNVFNNCQTQMTWIARAP
jgi:hypothetical protein